MVVGTGLPEVVSEKRVAVESEEMPNEELTKLTEFCEEGKKGETIEYPNTSAILDYPIPSTKQLQCFRLLPRIKRWPLH